jgi:tetratricopeptide (TPR) repeat protein
MNDSAAKHCDIRGEARRAAAGGETASRLRGAEHRQPGKRAKRFGPTIVVCLCLFVGLLAGGWILRQTDAPKAAPPHTLAHDASQPAAQPKQIPSTQPRTIDEIEQLDSDLSRIFRLIVQRENGAARIQLNKYLKLHPNDGKATFLFGLSYHREQKYGQAIPYFDQAIKFDPKYAPTHHFRAWSLYYLGELEESRAAFEAFLKFKPDEPDSLFGLGLIDLDEDRLDEAALRFQRSIEILNAEKRNPDLKALSKAHARLGEVYERQENLQQAKTELTIATDQFPDHYEAYYKLYRVLVRLGEREQAERIHKLYLAAKDRVRPGTSFPE